jgi:hypothetical protein
MISYMYYEIVRFKLISLTISSSNKIFYYHEFIHVSEA